MKNLMTSLLALAVTAPLAFTATVSPPVQPAVSAGGNSFNPVFSADGQHLVFVSHANNLVTNDDHGLWLDVFVRDLVSSNTVLVSVSTGGSGGANADANYPSVSANGQFIAFAGRASNLVPGDTNDAVDVFVRDVVAGTTRLASVDLNGNAPADPNLSSSIPLSGTPMISADGRYVVFESRATTLTADSVTTGDVHLYRRDLWSNTTVRANASVAISPATVQHELGGITPDGTFVAYSRRTNNGASSDVYRQQIGTGHVWLSANVAGLVAGSYRCSPPVLSDDGRYAAFHVTPLNGGDPLVMRRDTQAGTTTVISTVAGNLQHGLSISTDGSFVLYEVMDGSSTPVRLWNAQSNSTPISCGGNDTFGSPAMNSSATVVTLVGCSGVFINGTNTLGVTVRASVSTNGSASAGNYQFSTPVVSFNGARVAFATTANDLVPGDLNGQSDIFLRDVTTSVTELITKAAPSKPATTAFAHSFLGPNSVSADGRFVVSARYDDPSAWRDTNGAVDVFVTDRLQGTSHAVSIDTNLYTPADGGVIPGPGGQFYRSSTNSYSNPVISADGTTVAVALSGLIGAFGTYGEIYWIRSSNGVFGTGLRRAYATDNPSAPDASGSSFSLPSLSADGRDLVFDTTSSNFVFTNSLDNSFTRKVVLRRTAESNGVVVGANYLVSVTPGGTSGNNNSSGGLISPDGRWVIFESLASNLTADGTDGVLNLYACDLWSNVTHQISQPVSVSPVMRFTSGTASFSADSRQVSYWVQQSSPQPSFAVVHDLLARTNLAVATDGPGLVGRTKPSINSDGRLVAYRFRAGSNAGEIRVRDRVTGETDGIDARSVFSNLDSDPLLSGDGRYVIYRAKFPANDSHTNQIFVRDRLLGTTLMVSATAQGGAGNGSSTKPVLAANGRTVVFQSFASDLVAGDFNDKRDLFVLTLGGVDSEPDGMDDDWEMAYFETLSRDGSQDWDNDGATDLAEFLAGTDPKNGGSIFRVLTVAPAGGGTRTLLWSGNATRSYRAEFKDDLGATSWTALTGAISWNGTTASLTDPMAGSATNRYYRVLRLP